MATIKCKICGALVEVDANLTTFECEYCGVAQTLSKVKDDKISRLYDRANHLWQNKNYDKAMGIFESILEENNTDSEIYWSIVLCRYGIEYVEDPKTRRRLPTINRMQYTSILTDEDYKSALNYADIYQKDIYIKEAKEIDAIQQRILAVAQKESPFDVFICYKETDENKKRTQDSVYATEIYNRLEREGLRIFFARITLEDKLGEEYEPYIFSALNSAKIMIVLGTKLEYFNAVWVKNEWSRFHSLIKNGEKKMLITAYKNIDPYDLPDELSLQAQDMSKMGFLEDLVHVVLKNVKRNEKKPNEDSVNANKHEYIIPEKEKNTEEPVVTVAEKKANLFNIKIIGEFNKNTCITLIEEVCKYPLSYAKAIMESEEKIIAKSISMANVEKIINTFRANGIILTVEESIMFKNSNESVAKYTEIACASLINMEWDKAILYCEKALDIDYKDTYSYVIMLLAELKLTNEVQLNYLTESIDHIDAYKKALRYADLDMTNQLIEYNNCIINNKLENQEIETVSNNNTEKKESTNEEVKMQKEAQSSMKEKFDKLVNKLQSDFKQIVGENTNEASKAVHEEFSPYVDGMSNEETREKIKSLKKKRNSNVFWIIVWALIFWPIAFVPAIKWSKYNNEIKELEKNIDE